MQKELVGSQNQTATNRRAQKKRVYAWIDPELACQKALELSERYSNEAQVQKLELLTTVINELNTVAIRKGMLRPRK